MLGHAFNMQPASRQLCLILPFCLGTASSFGCIEVRIWGLLWSFRSILTALGTCRALCMPMPSISQEPGHLIPQLFLLSFLVSPLFADCYPLPKQLPLCVLNPSSQGKGFSRWISFRLRQIKTALRLESQGATRQM